MIKIGSDDFKDSVMSFIIKPVEATVINTVVYDFLQKETNLTVII